MSQGVAVWTCLPKTAWPPTSLINMLGSIPHQKFCFYHLPTRGRAWIKLGDAWYVSNVSIIIHCSMLLYYPFSMFMGFILYIYIIFGTNLLTGGPAHIAIFFAYFSVSKKRNIKRSPKGMQPSGAIFLEQTWSRGLGVDVKHRSQLLGSQYDMTTSRLLTRGILLIPQRFYKLWLF